MLCGRTEGTLYKNKNPNNEDDNSNMLGTRQHEGSGTAPPPPGHGPVKPGGLVVGYRVMGRHNLLKHNGSQRNIPKVPQR